ncbi:glycosyl hydrolase [Fimbriimonas ginsengisoli]|uniref:Glycoside hydrolase family protein n=1 Tax=Fimbriimonas ginsengisoli Gsoil 348 TaxID=661478 RepID=A0A068NM81_FIMGI|nr:glycosyl hydrolase [Fimbriimonas ginsengisoli]AIE83895.1 glycoside hydrolase family protein [Fimbriimonas ginsengisoli Gsoil 348]
MLAALALTAMLAAQNPILAGFKDVPPESRMRMYFRVFGPAWTKPEIDAHLDDAKQAGLGGLVAYFMYPVAIDDVARGIVNQRFGSPEFLSTFAYAAAEARRRQLRFGVNGGTGWPFGGPSVTPADAAKKLIEVVVPNGKPVPTLKPNERLIATSGNRLYIETPTGQNVKRAAFGAEGLVLDHFNEGALTRWLEANVRPILDQSKGNVDALGCDSLEVYSANWASDLPAQFKRRRGYELIPKLPQAFSDKSPEGDAVRFDYWRTLMELTAERFTKPLGDWSRKHRVKLEMEAYGTPPNPMSAYRSIDVPTGEHYEWRGFSVQKYVASAAHMARKNVIGSEAWTWLGLPNRLGDTLSDLKVVTDMTLLGGCNDLTGVDFAYSPKSAGQPGWVPYYGPYMNRNNPQWLAFPGLVEYVNRCQWMLRQGKPKVSVAVYLPVEDVLAHGGMDQMLLDFLVRDHFVTGKATSEFGLQNALKHGSALLQGIFSHGFDYDGIDFFAMNDIARVSGSNLTAGTSSYHTVVLPNLQTMELSALRKVHRFAEAGGLVIAVVQVPIAPAGATSEAERAEFQRLVEEVFGSRPVAWERHPCGKGLGVLLPRDEEVGAFLARAKRPQIVMEPVPETVGFVQRSLPGLDIYFLANVDSQPVSLKVRFPGAGAKPVEFWDPKSGRSWRLLPGASGMFGVSLSARGSAFLVVGAATASEPLPAEPQDEIAWEPEWQISFQGPDAPASFSSRELKPWPDPHFSGVATYQTKLIWNRPSSTVSLAFDEVREAAEVLVNGHHAAYVWSPPYEAEIGKFLRRGSNDIEVKVANLPLNRFLGLPDEDLGPLRAKYGNRFPAPGEKNQVKTPPPAGLIGRVHLRVR